MEGFISLLIAVFTIMIIVMVERFMYSLQPSKQKIIDYQKELDKMDANAKAEYGLDWKHNATTEIMKGRKQNKSFTLIFSGIFLAFVLIALTFFHHLSLTNIAIICISSIVLICYGLIKMAESKKLAIITLSFVFIVGTGCMYLFDMLMSASLYTYFYLCGLVALLGLLTLIPGAKKFVTKHGI